MASRCTASAAAIESGEQPAANNFATRNSSADSMSGEICGMRVSDFQSFITAA